MIAVGKLSPLEKVAQRLDIEVDSSIRRLDGRLPEEEKITRGNFTGV
jgi:hypothetical protein